MRKRASETGAKIFRTGLGWAGVAASDSGITRIVLPKADRKAVERELKGIALHDRSGLLSQAVRLLERFFNGEDVLFDLPLDLRYYTPFQQSVWRATAGIPFGETRSYKWIASRIRKPQAARAVGQAVGANPVPVLVP
jgi:methylated-DNA-[protein]-cysteine S-methyltransferase